MRQGRVPVEESLEGLFASAIARHDRLGHSGSYIRCSVAPCRLPGVCPTCGAWRTDGTAGAQNNDGQWAAELERCAVGPDRYVHDRPVIDEFTCDSCGRTRPGLPGGALPGNWVSASLSGALEGDLTLCASCALPLQPLVTLLEIEKQRRG